MVRIGRSILRDAWHVRESTTKNISPKLVQSSEGHSRDRNAEEVVHSRNQKHVE